MQTQIYPVTLTKPDESHVTITQIMSYKKVLRFDVTMTDANAIMYVCKGPAYLQPKSEKRRKKFIN